MTPGDKNPKKILCYGDFKLWLRIRVYQAKPKFGLARLGSA